MPFMKAMEKQWDTRRTGYEPETVTVRLSVRLQADAERVWTLLMAPELATLLDPAVVQTFRVPWHARG